jgi:DNA-binding NarL/FixJ family response regulator
MPVMNGRALAGHIATTRPDLAILFMSGYSPESVFRDGYLDARAAYLQKPFSREHLAAKVRSVLEGRHHPAAVG